MDHFIDVVLIQRRLLRLIPSSFLPMPLTVEEQLDPLKQVLAYLHQYTRCLDARLKFARCWPEGR